MALTKTRKSEVLTQIKELIADSKSVGFTQNTALSVAAMTDLRTQLREVGTTFMLAKKTLIKIAFKEVFNVEIDDSLLPNQIAMVVCQDDAVAGLAKVNDFMKKGKPGFEKMDWTAVYFEGTLHDAVAARDIAGMPSRETLLSRLVGSMQSPLSGLARFFDAAAKELETQGKAKVAELEGKKADAE